MMPGSKGVIQAEWKSGNRKIDMSLPLIIFQEDDVYIAYCPALDLTGSGNTEQQAIESFNIVIGEYFLYTTRKNTLADDLKQHGWIIRKNRSRQMRPPDLSRLLETNKDFSEIFNKHQFRKIDQRVQVPAI
jgi:hypothetical protein